MIAQEDPPDSFVASSFSQLPQPHDPWTSFMARVSAHSQATQQQLPAASTLGGAAAHGLALPPLQLLGADPNAPPALAAAADSAAAPGVAAAMPAAAELRQWGAPAAPLETVDDYEANPVAWAHREERDPQLDHQQADAAATAAALQPAALQPVHPQPAVQLAEQAPAANAPSQAAPAARPAAMAPVAVPGGPAASSLLAGSTVTSSLFEGFAGHDASSPAAAATAAGGPGRPSALWTAGTLLPGTASSATGFGAASLPAAAAAGRLSRLSLQVKELPLYCYAVIRCLVHQTSHQ